MIVIDVGCARYGGDYSVERLIEWFHPDVLLGFDPVKNVSEAMPSASGLLMADTNVVLRREAAWTYDGQVRFLEDGLSSQVGDADHWPWVRCVDLARVIEEMPFGQIVLKLDAEGAEFDLLEHLIATGAVTRLLRILVEWHCVECGRGGGGHREGCEGKSDGKRRRAIETALRDLSIPVEQWRH